MARLWSSGFELNSTSSDVEWNSSNGSPSIQTSVVRSGTYALQINSLSSGTAKRMRYYISSSVSNGPFFFRQYVRFATFPSAENTFTQVSSDLGGLRAKITVDNGGLLRLYDEDGQIGSESSALSVDTWYRIEYQFIRLGNGADATVKATIDGIEFAGATNRQIGTGLGIYDVGGNLQSEAQTTGNWYIDDIAINNNTGSVQNSYPGAGSILLLRPNAAGDSNQIGGAVSTNYQNVDDVTPDDVTTTNNTVSNSAGDIDDYNIEDTPVAIGSGDTINCVQVGVRFAGGAASSNDSIVARIKASASGTVEESGNITPSSSSYKTNASGDPRNYNLTLYDLPGASTTAWTKTDLDNAQIGFKKSVDSTNGVLVTAIWLVVDYTHVVSSFTPRSMLLGMG